MYIVYILGDNNDYLYLKNGKIFLGFASSYFCIELLMTTFSHL